MTHQALDTAAIQRFLARVRQAQTSGARDLRLSITEAGELTTALAQMMVQHLALVQSATGRMAMAQSQAANAAATSLARSAASGGLDGGSL